MMAGPKHLFSRSRCKLASAAVAGGENVALKQAFRELEDSYSRNNSSLSKSRYVCDFSSNDLSLKDVDQFATWLESSPLRIYALDLSFNRIHSESWEPVLQVLGRLTEHVDNLQLGGNYLPALRETDELRKLQQSGCVSLALPITGCPATDWQEKWNNIAEDFNNKAYDYDAPGLGAMQGSAYALGHLFGGVQLPYVSLGMSYPTAALIAWELSGQAETCLNFGPLQQMVPTSVLPAAYAG